MFCHPDDIIQLCHTIRDFIINDSFTSVIFLMPFLSLKDAMRPMSVGETGKKLAGHFCEHFMDIHIGTAKPGSLYFNSPYQRGIDNISVTALKSCSNDKVKQNHGKIASSIVWVSF